MTRKYDARERLAELAMPVLYLAAEEDHLVPFVEQATLMASLTRQGTMRVLRGHGHICLIAPDLDLGALLDDWITGDRPRPSA